MPPAAEQDEDADFNRLIAGDNLEGLDDFVNRPLELGEKADDAEDFEDIGDDDLAADETPAGDANKDTTNETARVKNEPDDELGLFHEEEDADDSRFDELFGDEPASPRLAPGDSELAGSAEQTHEQLRKDSLGSLTKEDSLFDQDDVKNSVEDSDIDDESDDDVREQRRLFEQSRQDQERRARGEPFNVPFPAPFTDAELFSIIWPRFDRNEAPHWNDLIPQKKAHWVPKQPTKLPKPIQPTKVSLEITNDQEKAFRLGAPQLVDSYTRDAEARARGVLTTRDRTRLESAGETESEYDISEEDEDIGGVRWQDLVALCEPWDIASTFSGSPKQDPSDADMSVDWPPSLGTVDFDLDPSTPRKRRKLTHSDGMPSQVVHSLNPHLDEPEKATARIARKVLLDLNDPEILVDVQPPNRANQTRRKVGSFARDVAGDLTRDLTRRYNISNDEAYDMLKENHQSKIRSTIGNLAIEHSLPAIKLQYPFYKIKLTPKQARSFHRPSLNFPLTTQFFDKPRHIKKKHMKGLGIKDLFSKTHDLTLGDNSHVLLLEYSEEYPAILSSFGMGNRLINYYRRKDNDDNARPKLDIGETVVLLPQDKSPFSIFGDVEKGQTMPTVHNGMYRAPVFRHENEPTDFIVSRSTTGVDGASYYLRNVENLHVVGQEFPSAEVPGTHSRKVTDASKKRLRMLSYRIYKKNNRLKNEMILKHLPGSDVAQNRSKMREFMDYDKDKGWLPRRNDVVPDDDVIRSWLKPEDVCLLEAMQVGDRQLQDAGYNKNEADVDGEEEVEKDGQSLDQQLAPWNLTKNFLNACQGKAMLQLHGEGDPSGIGEAFNFIRTSMKGGFQRIGSQIGDRSESKRGTNGHNYNVAEQQRAYNETIKIIWEAQLKGLSSTIEHNYADFEDGEAAGTPAPGRSATPGAARFDDESTYSTSSQLGKVMKITRHFKDKYGKDDTRVEIVKDQKVIREYQRRRRIAQFEGRSFAEFKRTGNAEEDAIKQKILEAELARLQRNQERREAREKAKGILPTSAASPDAGAASPAGNPPSGSQGGSSRKNTGATVRKCANCGQVGHIKTNKKLCSTCTYMNTPVRDHGFSVKQVLDRTNVFRSRG